MISSFVSPILVTLLTNPDSKYHPPNKLPFKVGFDYYRV